MFSGEHMSASARISICSATKRVQKYELTMSDFWMLISTPNLFSHYDFYKNINNYEEINIIRIRM